MFYCVPSVSRVHLNFLECLAVAGALEHGVNKITVPLEAVGLRGWTSAWENLGLSMQFEGQGSWTPGAEGKKELKRKISKFLESALIGMCLLKAEKWVRLLRKEERVVRECAILTARKSEKERWKAMAIRRPGQGLSEHKQGGSEKLFSPMTFYSKRSDPLASRRFLGNYI